MSLYQCLQMWLLASKEQRKVDFAILTDLLEELLLQRGKSFDWLRERHEVRWRGSRAIQKHLTRPGVWNCRQAKYQDYLRFTWSMAIADLNLLKMFGVKAA